MTLAEMESKRAPFLIGKSQLSELVITRWIKSMVKLLWNELLFWKKYMYVSDLLYDTADRFFSFSVYFQQLLVM